MAGIRIFKWFLLITALPILTSATRANAQSVGFGVGWYHSINPESGSPHLSFEVDKKPLLSFELFFANILNCKRTSRLGIRASFLSARTRLTNQRDPIPPGSGHSRDWMTSVLMSYQRKLYNQGSLYFGMNFSAGVSFIGDEGGDVFEVCTPPFCTLEEIRLSFLPGLDYIVRVYNGLGIHVSGRYNLISGNKKDLYPFASGFLFEGGLLFEIPKTGVR